MLIEFLTSFKLTFFHNAKPKKFKKCLLIFWFDMSVYDLIQSYTVEHKNTSGKKFMFHGNNFKQYTFFF